MELIVGDTALTRNSTLGFLGWVGDLPDVRVCVALRDDLVSGIPIRMYGIYKKTITNLIISYQDYFERIDMNYSMSHNIELQVIWFYNALRAGPIYRTQTQRKCHATVGFICNCNPTDHSANEFSAPNTKTVPDSVSSVNIKKPMNASHQ
jgi:hypothetical protein